MNHSTSDTPTTGTKRTNYALIIETIETEPGSAAAEIVRRKEETLTNEEHAALKYALNAHRSDEAMKESRQAAEDRVRGVRNLFDKFPRPQLGLTEETNADEDLKAWYHKELLHEVKNRIESFSLVRLYELAECIEAVEGDTGCTSPAEQLITSLVGYHSMYGLTPADAAHYMEEFREDFDDNLRTAKHFATRYAPLFNSPQK